MNAGVGLWVGLALGMRHALDADHVVALTAMLQERAGVVHALRTSALWSLGHTLTFLSVGVAIIALDLQVGDTFERATELAVGATLIAVGLRHAWVHGRRAAAVPVPVRATARPLVVGLVHGLAGSHAVALMALAALGDRDAAAVYLGASALGMALAMAALTGVLAWTVGLVRGGGAPAAGVRPGRAAVGLALVRVAAAVNVGLGAVILAEGIVA